jgi:hypothetical protein
MNQLTASERAKVKHSAEWEGRPSPEEEVRTPAEAFTGAMRKAIERAEAQKRDR